MYQGIVVKYDKLCNIKIEDGIDGKMDCIMESPFSFFFFLTVTALLDKKLPYIG